MSVAQVRGQSNYCLKSPAANVTGVGRFSMCRCFLHPAHSLVRPQLHISSDGIVSASHHVPRGHVILCLFPPIFYLINVLQMSRKCVFVTLSLPEDCGSAVPNHLLLDQ